MARSIDVKLIIGLGNPGVKYTRTRHNAGFWFVDVLAEDSHSVFHYEKKFYGDVAKITVCGTDIRLLKPDTFMNNSGKAVRALMNFYRLAPEQLLVAHDEIDLPAGTVKLKTSGGHGGHNGLRDIINHCGSKDFHRLRIGVGHPGSKDQVIDYVLHEPSRDDRMVIDNNIIDAVRIMPELARGDMERAMHILHSRKKTG